MADNARAMGFRWLQNPGGAPNPKPILKRVASAYQASANPGAVSVNLWPGDPVKLVNDGTVALAAAGDAVFGVIVGILPYFDSGQGVMTWGNSLPGGTTYGTNLERQSKVMVVPVAGHFFEIDCDDAVTATTEATYISYIEENCDHVFVPVAADRRAYPMLDISTHATATAQWRIVDISRRTNQDFTGNYVKLVVTANEVQQAPFATAGV